MMKWIRTIGCTCSLVTLLAVCTGCQTIDPNVSPLTTATDEKSAVEEEESETQEPITIHAASYGMSVSIPGAFCMIDDQAVQPGSSHDIGEDGMVAIDQAGRNCITISTQDAIDFNTFSALTGEEIIASYARYTFENVKVSAFESVTISGFPAYRISATGTLSGITCYITSIFTNLTDYENGYSCAITYAITDTSYTNSIADSVKSLQFDTTSGTVTGTTTASHQTLQALHYKLPDAYQCTVNLPDGWSFQEKPDGDTLSTVPAVGVPDDSESGDTITFGVTNGTVENTTFAALTSESYLSIAKEQIQDVALVDYSSFQIGTYPAHKIVFTGTKDNESLKMTAIYINRSDLNLVYAIALCDKSGTNDAISNHLEDYIAPSSEEQTSDSDAATETT